MKEKHESTWALVTGASKGIGKAIAMELASKGYSLVLVARSEGLLETVANEINARHQVPVRVLACDASMPETPLRIHQFCVDEGIPVSILVNNAGIGVYESFHESQVGDLMRMNALNVDAVIRITHAMLPMLLAQPKAHVMNVGSTGAFQPMPTMALYGAGKAYIRAFTWALRHELRDGPVRVTCLSPGGVWTEFMDAAGNQHVSEKNRLFMMHADKCARIAVRGMLRGKAEVIPGWHNALAAFMTRFMPTAFNTWIAARVFQK